MTDQLKPCPFCGTPPGERGVMALTERPDFPHWYVQCTGCGASSGRFDDEETAVEFWNERYCEGALRAYQEAYYSITEANRAGTITGLIDEYFHDAAVSAGRVLREIDADG